MDQQLKVYRSGQSYTPAEEMQLQEMLEEEVSSILKIYKIAAGVDTENLNMTEEEVQELVDNLLA